MLNSSKVSIYPIGLCLGNAVLSPHPACSHVFSEWFVIALIVLRWAGSEARLGHCLGVTFLALHSQVIADVSVTSSTLS